jgi:proteic killer suppression protein
VIRSFGDSHTQSIFLRQRSRRFSPAVRRAALKKLLILHAAERLEDLTVPPGDHLEKLSVRRAGQHSIRIDDQWRVCFVWKGSDAFDIEVVDYH